MYTNTQPPAPPKSDNIFPINCWSFSLSIVCDVEDGEADDEGDELICWA
ncbi:MAG: hypothetical protein ACJ71M_06975 [Nitrososphaeraceae archaeon]